MYLRKWWYNTRKLITVFFLIDIGFLLYYIIFPDGIRQLVAIFVPTIEFVLELRAVVAAEYPIIALIEGIGLLIALDWCIQNEPNFTETL